MQGQNQNISNHEVHQIVLRHIKTFKDNGNHPRTNSNNAKTVSNHPSTKQKANVVKETEQNKAMRANVRSYKSQYKSKP